MDRDKSAVVSECLVEADMIGHTTHGSGLVESYLDALASGEMNGTGDVKVLSDRADPPAPMSFAVFVQVIDPAAFGERKAFARRAGFVTDACRAVPPAPGIREGRVPGDGARSRRKALSEGVAVDSTILDGLTKRARGLDVQWPCHR